jgi:hypothetical protein
LDTILEERFAALDVAARRLLEAVALAARPVAVDAAASAAGLLREQYAAAERVLRHAQLLRSAVGANLIEPFHDRIREAAVARLSVASQQLLHQSFLTTLLDSGERDPDPLFWHARGSGLNDRAADYAAQAAVKASQALAFAQAAQRYRDALALISADDARAQPWRVAAAEAYSLAGRLKEAGMAYLAAADGMRDDPVQIDLERRAAEQLLLGCEVDAGMTASKRVLARVGLRLPESRLTTILSILGRTLWLKRRGLSFRHRQAQDVPVETLQKIDVCFSVGTGISHFDAFRAYELTVRATLMALSAGEPRRVVLTVSHWALLQGLQNPERGEGIFRHVEALTRKESDPELRAQLAIPRAFYYLLTEQFRTGSEFIAGLLPLIREATWYNAAEHRRVLQSLHCGFLFLTGRLREYMELAPKLIREAEETDDLFYLASVLVVGASNLWLVLDQSAAAYKTLSQVSERLHAHASPAQPFLLPQAAMLWWHLGTDLYCGAVEQAEARLQAHVRRLQRSMLLRMRFHSINYSYAVARIELAKATCSRPLTRAIAQLLRAGGVWATSLAALMQGCKDALEQRREAAIVSLKRAIELLDTADMELHKKIAMVRLGQVLNNDQGRALIDEARAWMSEQGVKNPARLEAMLAPMPLLVTA